MKENQRRGTQSRSYLSTYTYRVCSALNGVGTKSRNQYSRFPSASQSLPSSDVPNMTPIGISFGREQRGPRDLQDWEEEEEEDIGVRENAIQRRCRLPNDIE